MPKNERVGEEIFTKFKNWIEKSFPEKNPYRLAELKFAARAEFYAQKLSPPLEPVVGIALYGRLAGRALPNFELTYTPQELWDFYREEICDSPSMIKTTGFLKRENASRQLINTVVNLMRARENSGLPGLVKDAWKISFLQVLTPLFILWTPKHLSLREVEDVINSKYYTLTLSTVEAKAEAQPFYDEAMDSLRLALKEARSQALASYFRLVAQHDHSMRRPPSDKDGEVIKSPTEEEIEALRRAADEVLSLK